LKPRLYSVWLLLLVFYSDSLIDEKSVALLEEFSKDPEPLVAQSCEVALSMLEFERSGKSFEVCF
jgi:deoxyhypusine monooxygenase